MEIERPILAKNTETKIDYTHVFNAVVGNTNSSGLALGQLGYRYCVNNGNIVVNVNQLFISSLQREEVVDLFAYIQVLQAEFLEGVVQSGFNNIGVELAVVVMSAISCCRDDSDLRNGGTGAECSGLSKRHFLWLFGRLKNGIKKEEQRGNR
ncbi:hypothetical protein TMatcc_007324 [Talaromyces marneffei ATCC 18224]